jgi:hypothetical protein
VDTRFSLQNVRMELGERSLLLPSSSWIFSLRIPATHPKHFEERPTCEPGSVVLLAV